MTKYIRLFIGVNLYAAAINFLQSLNLGMGSFDSLTLQLQQILGIDQFGNASLLIHFFFFVILLIVAKTYSVQYKMICLSIFSIFILTRFINFYSMFNVSFEPTIFNSVWIIMLLNLGLYLIASTNIIIAPFDKFVVETSKYMQIKLGTSRFACDVLLLLLVLIINLLLESPIPITLYTLVITFATGLNIGLYQHLELLLLSSRRIEAERTELKESLIDKRP